MLYPIETYAENREFHTVLYYFVPFIFIAFIHRLPRFYESCFEMKMQSLGEAVTLTLDFRCMLHFLINYFFLVGHVSRPSSYVPVLPTYCSRWSGFGPPILLPVRVTCDFPLPLAVYRICCVPEKTLLFNLRSVPADLCCALPVAAQSEFISVATRSEGAQWQLKNKKETSKIFTTFQHSIDRHCTDSSLPCHIIVSYLIHKI
jgi:hypothetical protein